MIRKLIKEQLQEALNNQEREDKIDNIVSSLSNLEDADVNYILGQVRNRLRKDDMNEKLDKDATAGDYVEDFEKSDAKQFKGKSKKKKQQMAIAAYLDAQEDK